MLVHLLLLPICTALRSSSFDLPDVALLVALTFDGRYEPSHEIATLQASNILGESA